MSCLNGICFPPCYPGPLSYTNYKSVSHISNGPQGQFLPSRLPWVYNPGHSSKGRSDIHSYLLKAGSKGNIFLYFLPFFEDFPCLVHDHGITFLIQAQYWHTWAGSVHQKSMAMSPSILYLVMTRSSEIVGPCCSSSYSIFLQPWLQLHFPWAAASDSLSNHKL